MLAVSMNSVFIKILTKVSQFSVKTILKHFTASYFLDI